MARRRYVETADDEAWAPDGGRIIDIGGTAEEQADDGVGKNLVIFAVDPGYTTGWAALKVPVRRLRSLGATRTLPRCRWRHGEIRRSVALGDGPMAQAVDDSRHVTHILNVARKVHGEMVFDADDYPESEEEGWESDEFVFVLESFTLRMLSMDSNLLAPVRVLDRILDRLYVQESRVPVFHQQPSEAKSSVTDARLKSWAMYDAHSGPHARDADRHAIYFLRRFADSRELQRRLGFGD